jgi:hypothetical protein
MSSGDGSEVFVDHQLLQEQLRLAITAIPFVWMISYRGADARQNIRYFENGVRHLNLTIPIRVFMSVWTHAVVISFVPLESIKEPHVREWFSTFYEVTINEAKVRLDNFPDWPYDGRTSCQAYLDKDKLSSKEVIARSRVMLKAKRVEFESGKNQVERRKSDRKGEFGNAPRENTKTDYPIYRARR